MVDLSWKRIASVFNIAGGLLMMIYAAMALAQSISGGLFQLGEFFVGGLLVMTLGILAIVWSRKADAVIWSAILIIVGISSIAAGSGAGFLVVIGGVFGLMDSTGGLNPAK